jgi:hypothetical protein
VPPSCAALTVDTLESNTGTVDVVGGVVVLVVLVLVVPVVFGVGVTGFSA